MVLNITRLPIAVLAAAFAGTICLAAVSDADAGPRHRKGYHGKHYGHGGGYKHRRHGYRGGDVLGAGIAGFLIGSLVAAPPAYAVQPYYAAPTVIYERPPVAYGYPEPIYSSPPVYPAPPVYSDGYRRPYSEYEQYDGRTGSVYSNEEPPEVLTYEETVGDNPQIAGTEPGSAAWFEYCRSKFRSFDDQSGTYLGYDGRRHLCVVR